MPPENIEAFRPVRETARELGIDLATGERYFSKWQYAPLLAGQYVDVIQPDLCHAGGITEVKKIAALAEVQPRARCAPQSPRAAFHGRRGAHRHEHPQLSHAGVRAQPTLPRPGC